jgi:hypothetical protein
MTKQAGSYKQFNDLPYITEQLKVSKHEVRARINVLTGQEGDIWVCYSSSLNTSGYGATKKEAEESFQHNLEVFCEYLLKLKSSQQQTELRNLGWDRKIYARKQFSKAYVDENGDLQNLTNTSVQALETTAA